MGCFPKKNRKFSAKTIFFKSSEWKLKIWYFLILYFWIFCLNLRIRVSVRSNACKDFENGEALCPLIGLLCLSNYLVNFPSLAKDSIMILINFKFCDILKVKYECPYQALFRNVREWARLTPSLNRDSRPHKKLTIHHTNFLIKQAENLRLLDQF